MTSHTIMYNINHFLPGWRQSFKNEAQLIQISLADYIHVMLRLQKRGINLLIFQLFV